jgi:hypothetical protein
MLPPYSGYLHHCENLRSYEIIYVYCYMLRAITKVKMNKEKMEWDGLFLNVDIKLLSTLHCVRLAYCYTINHEVLLKTP